jgi:hypothetical protein
MNASKIFALLLGRLAPAAAPRCRRALRGRPLDAESSQSDALHALLGETLSYQPAPGDSRIPPPRGETLLDETLQLAWERARLGAGVIKEGVVMEFTVNGNLVTIDPLPGEMLSDLLLSV